MNSPDTEPQPQGQALPAGTRLEEFIIERVLGAGGFGVTYLARDVSLDRLVVIKENLPVQFAFRDTHSLTVAPRHSHGEDAENFAWSLENFSKEAAMLASLDHPGIVRVLRRFEAFGTAYFVMPFVEGESLDELMRSRRAQIQAFDADEITGLLEHILVALAYLHERGIYHRDIKPGNILVTKSGVPVLIDFGSARQRLSERSMTVVESAGYTPFEQLQSRGNVGPWSDLYALGATVTKLVSGELPPKAMDRMRRDPFVPLAERPALRGVYSPALLASIDTALRVDEDERWQKAQEWLAALASKSLEQQKGSAPTSSVPEPPVVETATKPDGTDGKEIEAVGVAIVPALVLILILMLGGMFLGVFVLNSNTEVVQADESDPSQHDITSLVVTPPQSAPASQVGSLHITSQPSGAKVVDGAGRSHGLTPKTIHNLPAGVEQTFGLELTGYAPNSVSEVTQSGENLTLPTVTLTPLPQNVIITSTPMEAEVWDGDSRIGMTESTIQNIMPGTRVSYMLRKEGYEDKSVSDVVKVGETLVLNVTLLEKPRVPSLVSGKVGDELRFPIGGNEAVVLKYVPGGRYQMGSPPSEMGRGENEDQVWVTLNSHFWLGEAEVTQIQWMALMGSNPSHFKDGDWEKLPVESVSWDDAMDSIKKLNAEYPPGRGWKWALPSEAQWERACRGGTTTATAFGQSLNSTQANFNGSFPYDPYDEMTAGPYLQKTTPVKSYQSNAYGLYDMHGNVWEWCSDAYQKGLPGGDDPLISIIKWDRSHHVFRGGCWDSSGRNCRSAFRYWFKPGDRHRVLGFRLAVVPAE